MKQVSLFIRLPHRITSIIQFAGLGEVGEGFEEVDDMICLRTDEGAGEFFGGDG